MKTTNHCPKCDSTKIIVYEGKSYNQYSIGATTKWGLVSTVLDRYFCVNCGYSEEYAKLDSKFLKWANEELKKEKNKRGMGDGFV